MATWPSVSHREVCPCGIPVHSSVTACGAEKPDVQTRGNLAQPPFWVGQHHHKMMAVFKVQGSRCVCVCVCVGEHLRIYLGIWSWISITNRTGIKLSLDSFGFPLATMLYFAVCSHSASLHVGVPRSPSYLTWVPVGLSRYNQGLPIIVDLCGSVLRTERACAWASLGVGSGIKVLTAPSSPSPG